MASEEVSKLNAYAVLLGSNNPAKVSKLNAYSVLLAPNNPAQVSKLNAYAVLLSVPSRADGFATVAGVGASLSFGATTGEADGFATVAGVGGLGPVIHPAAGEADGYATVNGAGYAIVTPDVLHGPSGLGWSLHRRPTSRRSSPRIRPAVKSAWRNG